MELFDVLLVNHKQLSVEERKRNVAGVFELKKKIPEGRSTCIIIDDVYTTGATTKACSYALLQENKLDVKICTLLLKNQCLQSLIWWQTTM